MSMLDDYKRLVEAPMIREYEETIAALRDEIDRLSTPSQRLDAATVERCAQIIRDWHPDEEAAGCDATWADCKYALLAAVTSLATEPHQHGAGNGEKHGG